MMFSNGYCGGMGVGGWALMIGFVGALIAVVLWTVTRLFPSGEQRSEARAVRTGDTTAMDIRVAELEREVARLRGDAADTTTAV